jgi:hypothetical protein
VKIIKDLEAQENRMSLTILWRKCRARIIHVWKREKHVDVMFNDGESRKTMKLGIQKS